MVATLISRSSALSGPRGQLFTTCCAYSALTCQTISLLLMDYTRLALPFGIAVLPLSIIGRFSSSRRSFALVAVAFWFISINALVRPLFNMSEQFTLMPRMQQQVIQLENQYNHMNMQYTTLLVQTSFLQSMLNQAHETTNHKDLALEGQLFRYFSTTIQAYTQFQTSVPDTNGQIYVNAASLEYGNRDFLDDDWIQSYQQTITVNVSLIRANQQLIASINQIITNNNALLPPSLNVHLARWVDQKICVRNDHCIQLTWQQPFIEQRH